MSETSPIKTKIEEQLQRMAKAKKRLGLLRETALLKFSWVPNIRRGIEYVTEALWKEAAEKPLDPRLLGESINRAKFRAVGRELRHLQDFLDEVAPEPQQGDPVERAALDRTDRRDCDWAAEQRREIMRLAVRFERRVGPAPEVGKKDSDTEE